MNHDFARLREDVVRVGLKLGLEIPLNWSGVDTLIPIIEKMKSEGRVVVVKWDGGRTSPGDSGPYTCVVTDTSDVQFDFIRIDTHRLEDALAFCIAGYGRQCWGESL